MDKWSVAAVFKYMLFLFEFILSFCVGYFGHFVIQTDDCQQVKTHSKCNRLRSYTYKTHKLDRNSEKQQLNTRKTF